MHKKKASKMQCKQIHLSFTIFIIIIILKFQSEKEKYKVNYSSSTIALNYQLQTYYKSTVYQILKKKENQLKTDRSSRKICLLLLILSNDVHPNPGPKLNPFKDNSPKQNPSCAICDGYIQNENLIKCSNCLKSYHKECSARADKEINKSYEWICPTENCPNNYEENFNSIANIQSQNNFEVLNTDYLSTLDGTVNTIHHNTEPDSNNEPNENLKLLNELTTIKFEEYQGKDLCRGCYLPVKFNQQAISCDNCDMWIHRKCSDMSKKSYEKHRFLNYFRWICNKCRKIEVENSDQFDPKLLAENEQPQPLTELKTDRNEILIINMNCRSSINKTEDINYIFNEVSPDIACHSETWFDDSVPRQAYIPPGYKVIRKDRSDIFKQTYGKASGGGIAIYYKEHLLVERNNHLTDENEEILWVQVKAKTSFMLGTIYRASYTNTLINIEGETKIEENIRKASEISDRIVVTGDFNVDMNNEIHRETITLNNIFDTYGLTQIINKPTRVDPRSKKPTLIDHIWTNLNQLVRGKGTFLGVSDHLGTYVKLNITKNEPSQKFIKIRSYVNYNEELFNSNLSEALNKSNIDQLIEEKEINLATEELVKITQNTINKLAPIKIVRQKDKNKYIPWYTTELQNMIKEKNQSLSNYFFFGIEAFKKRAKDITNKIKYLKRKLKSNYFTEKINSFQDNPKKYWQIINELTQRSESKETTEPDKMNQEKANSFNNYFATVGEEIQKKLKKQFEINDFTGILGFEFNSETQSSIAKIIDNIRYDVATGHDGISAKIIKDGKPTLTPILTKLVNLSYEKNVFPDCMKIAAIKALHKKDDKNTFSNYRPISILPTLSKIFERSATKQLVEHLEKNNIIRPSQHAYRKGHSTITCLFEVVNYLYKLIDEKKIAAVVSLDLSKAFDSINHNLLLNKLSSMQLSENSLLWVKSYLSNRKQYTKFKDYISTEQPITAGVPQGSIIGPLLFICYINDLYPAFDSESKVYSYADDTQIIVNAKNTTQLIKRIDKTIETAQAWYSNNSMQNNIGKTEIMITKNKGSNNAIKLKITEDGKRKLLKPKPFIKVLGVYLDENLDWNKHLRYVKKVSTNTIRNIHRVNHLLPVKTRINLYNSLIVPHFDYADIIFGGCNKQGSKYLQTAQNFAIRSITGTRKSVSPKESFKKLKFLDLESRRLVHEAVFAHKSLLNLNPEQISLDHVKQLSTSLTRNSNNGSFNLPVHRCSKYKKSPFFRTIVAWNTSPKDIPTENIKIFKKHFQRSLIDKKYTH